MNDFDKIINLLLEKLRPQINEALPSLIRDEHLDPLPRVISGKASAGKINLGICHATADASYNLKNLTGLSSLNVDNITLVNSSGSIESFSGFVNIGIHLREELALSASGKVGASCGFISDHIGLSGQGHASGVSATAKAKFEGGATLKEGEARLQSLHVNDVGLNFGSVNVSIDGLGIFNVLVEPITSIIADAFKSYITGALDGVVKDVINEQIDHLLPLTVKV